MRDRAVNDALDAAQKSGRVPMAVGRGLPAGLLSAYAFSRKKSLHQRGISAH